MLNTPIPLLTPLESIWDEFGESLRQFILRRVDDAQVADDILQDVFLKIHAGIGGLNDEQRLQAWVFQIARNAIADYYRAPRRAQDLPDDMPAPEADSADTDCERQLARSLRRMVGALPAEYRDALLLTAFDGLTQKEAATRMGVSLSGAKSRVQRAREKLRAMFFECCHFEFDRLGRVIDYTPLQRDCRACCEAATAESSLA